jgi:hypothetical protein
MDFLQRLFLRRRKSERDAMAEALQRIQNDMPEAIRLAHVHCSNHRQEIIGSDLCGCFYCERTFAPEQITEWIDDNRTAMCPECGIDSVLGSSSGLPITKEFLGEMNRHWF